MRGFYRFVRHGFLLSRGNDVKRVSRAAELLGAPVRDILDLMGAHQVPYLDYAEGDVRSEAKALADALGK